MNGNNFAGMQDMMGMFRQFQRNPAQFLAQRGLGIPQQCMGSPNDAIQYLMNNRGLTQRQYDWAVRQARAMQGRTP